MTSKAFRAWLAKPQPIERIVLLRVFAPLATLGFMSTRIVHSEHWLGDTGFNLPDLGGDWRQPLYVPGLPSSLAWGLSALMVLSGIATSLGLRTRVAAAIFAATLFFVAAGDRLSAFTVSKLSPVIMLAIAASAAGARYGVDAYRQRREGPLPTHVSGGAVRFVQIFLPVFYCASGWCKAKGDWLERFDVIWTQLHSSYQTAFAHFIANVFPAWSWGVLQVTTLAFEALAPVWFAWGRTRPLAFAYGVAMHAMIGLMFGPVRWFSLLMITLLVAAYLPDVWLRRVAERASWLERRKVGA